MQFSKQHAWTKISQAASIIYITPLNATKLTDTYFKYLSYQFTNGTTGSSSFVQHTFMSLDHNEHFMSGFLWRHLQRNYSLMFIAPGYKIFNKIGAFKTILVFIMCVQMNKTIVNIPQYAFKRIKSLIKKKVGSKMFLN